LSFKTRLTGITLPKSGFGSTYPQRVSLRVLIEYLQLALKVRRIVYKPPPNCDTSGMSTVVALVQPDPPDDLARLLARRDELMGEFARLPKVENARAGAEARLAEVDAEQGALDEDEREAWRAWAERAEGPPPSPRTKEREAIARKRALGATAGLEPATPCPYARSNLSKGSLIPI
jgi:hypothetical protein